MYIFKRIKELQFYLKSCQGSIGFVPTMGALHEGHISLIQKSSSENDITVCSIFVNPTQFNDKKDFEKYPITIDEDIKLLIAAQTDVLFLPEVDEMYPKGIGHIEMYAIGYLDTILDGAFRPGHFNGVCNIVHRLLDAVQPLNLYMGEKDFQQCLVVAQLIEQIGSKVNLITCPTLREQDGLAMSSRNRRLSAAGRQQATAIYTVLKTLREQQFMQSFATLQQQGLQYLQEKGFEPEYILLANASNLQLLDNFQTDCSMVVLVAAKLEGVRLIDNMRI